METPPRCGWGRLNRRAAGGVAMARGRGCAPWEPRERVGTGNMAGTQLFSLSFIHSRVCGGVTWAWVPHGGGGEAPWTPVIYQAHPAHWWSSRFLDGKKGEGFFLCHIEFVCLMNYLFFSNKYMQVATV